jgi:polyphosphate kinase 2 (PPK2 family)
VGRLEELDLSQKLGKKDYRERLPVLQDLLEARRLQLAGLVGDQRLGPPVLILFEGWDASGKGGAIQRLVAELDHRHVRVQSFDAPTDDEKRHHFLWRFSPALPGWGGAAVLDRSWYGRVLVERVEGFASDDEWRRGYDEILSFERSLAAQGTILIKFWMHISDEEQLRRFHRREVRPLKRWKLTGDDWRNREKRAAYVEAIEEMLARTDHDAAPWTLVPAESKRFARIFVLERAIEQIEAGMRKQGFEPLTDEELEAA